MPSSYIQLFIEAINCSLLGSSSEKLTAILATNKFDWKVVSEKAMYHGIRPILVDAFKKINEPLLDNLFVDELKILAFQQSIFNLSAARETVCFLDFLTRHNIKAIPFKGIFFIHELYDKKSLREGSDLDILVRREDAARALKLLIDEGGYRFSLPDKFLNERSTDQVISVLLSMQGFHEVGLDKKQDSMVHIDFHWDAYENFYQYKLPVDLLFSNIVSKPFFDSECSLPDKETIFWTLIIHHGGREIWSRLKYFCDLIAFYQKYGAEMNWEEILKKAEKFKMKRLIVDAFYCLYSQFHIQAPAIIIDQFTVKNRTKSNLLKLLDYWEFAQPIDFSYTAKWKFERLYFSLQDDNYSYMRHAKHSFLKRSFPNPIEPERVIVFSENYPILNFFGKLATAFPKYCGLKK